MAITRGPGIIYKLAADAKPTASLEAAGMLLKNTDDKKEYYNSGTDWILQTPPAYKEFRIYKDGTTTYIIDEQGRQVGTPGSDTVAVLQPVLDGMVNGYIYRFIWDAGPYTLENPILLPSVSSTNQFRKVIFQTPTFSVPRNASSHQTLFQPSATFPNQRYLIETQNSGDATAKTSQFLIDGFNFFNNQPQGTKDVGGILMEAGSILNGNLNWAVTNCNFNYIWRGIHQKGLVWYGYFANLVFSISSDGWIGDACLLMDMGGHTGGFGPAPKGSRFQDIYTNSGDGSYANFMDMRAYGYGLFDNIWVDGKFYRNAVFNLDNTDTPLGAIGANTFRHITTLDLEADTPDVRKSNIYMHGGKVYDNLFQDCRLSNYPSTVFMDGSGVFRNELEIAARWTSTPAIVNDTGTVETNTIIVRPGTKQDAGEVPITHTGGVSRIIDHRRSAEKAGTAVISDGGTVSHGLMTTPLWVWAQSRIAGEFCSVTARSTTTFTVAIKKWTGGTLTAGTASQTIDWKAGIYA